MDIQESKNNHQFFITMDVPENWYEDREASLEIAKHRCEKMNAVFDKLGLTHRIVANEDYIMNNPTREEPRFAGFDGPNWQRCFYRIEYSGMATYLLDDTCSFSLDYVAK